MKSKLLLILILFSIKAIAQNDKKILLGKVYDSLGPLPNAHIINNTTLKATFSNDMGEFKLYAKENDSIFFTSIGYKTVTLIIKPSHITTNETIIFLKKENYELDEIKIKKHNLTGSLTNDIRFVKKEELINAQTLKLPNSNTKILTVSERRLYTAKGGSLLSIDRLINTVSGRIKKLKKLNTIENQEREVQYLKNTFNNYFLDELKIDAFEINLFIYYCLDHENYKITKQKGTFYLIEFFKKRASQFKDL